MKRHGWRERGQQQPGSRARAEPLFGFAFRNALQAGARQRLRFDPGAFRTQDNRNLTLRLGVHDERPRHPLLRACVRRDEEDAGRERRYGAPHAPGDTVAFPFSDFPWPITSTLTVDVPLHAAAAIGASKMRVAPGRTYQPFTSVVKVWVPDVPRPCTATLSTATCRLPVLCTSVSTLPPSTFTLLISIARDG